MVESRSLVRIYIHIHIYVYSYVFIDSIYVRFFLIGGISNGISGLVTKPIEGVKKQGALGLIKGVGKGILGIHIRIHIHMYIYIYIIHKCMYRYIHIFMY